MDPREDARRRRQGAAAASGPASSPQRRVGRRPRWSEAAWLAILTAIGVVQIVRAQWFDAAVFFGAVLALAADSLGLLPGIASRGRAPLRWSIGAAAAVAVVMSFLPRHGTWMGVAVIAIGMGALALTWPQPTGDDTRGWSRGLRRLAVAWSVILVAGCLWELFQFILGRVEPELRWFALSDLVDPLVASVPGHVLFVAAWVGAGVFLVRRGRAR